MDVLNYLKEQIEHVIKKKGLGKEKFLVTLGNSTNKFNQSFYRRSIRLETYIEICEALEVDPASLFPGKEPQNYQNDKYVKLLEDQVTLLNEKLESYGQRDDKSKAG